MKKRGFTLAEVMVALALIGVIASLTIPTFISSSRNKANAAKLASTITAVENAFGAMLAAESANDLTETRFGASFSAEDLGEFLKLGGSREGNDNYTFYYGEESPYRDLSGNSVAPITGEFSYRTKNGSLIFATNDINILPIILDDDVARTNGIGENTVISRILIDVNGANEPNIAGRDVFEFLIGGNGTLYPAGSLAFSVFLWENGDQIWSDNNSNFACTDQNKTTGCTARLIENNYEIDF